jgi:ABC-type branched-subunit amino acid transport system substrate-binding protein
MKERNLSMTGIKNDNRNAVDADRFDRRRFLRGLTAGLGTWATVGTGAWVLKPSWANAAAGPIKIGIATDITGAIAYAGNACWQTAQLVVEEINASGGISGRPVELHLTDTASNETLAVANVRKLIQQEKVDVVFGGVTSSMRQAIKDPIVTRGRTLYVYPQLYEGQECTPFLFNTGPTPAQQCDTFIPWLIKGGAKRFCMPSANYVWPQLLNQYARKVIEANGGEVVLEEYYPIDQIEYSSTVSRIMNENVDCVFNTVIPPGVGPFFKQLYTAGFLKRGGRLACAYYDENLLNVNQPEEMEGLATCLDFFQSLDDPFSQSLVAKYNARFPDSQYRFVAGSAATGMWRGLKLYEKAVNATNGDTAREAVAAALDGASIAEGPGGPSSMVAGKNHCRMNMYIAVAKAGAYEIQERFDQMDPKEC